jgi:hypothetical protein
MSLLDGILGGAQSVMAFGQQQTENRLARDRYDLDVARLGEQKRQYVQTYDESVRQFNINDEYNEDSNTRLNAKEARDADAAGEEKVRKANDKFYETLDMGGYIAKDRMSLNYKQINEDIAAGRDSDRFGAAEQIVLGFATQFGNLPEGSKATSVEALDGGGYAITVTNADGSKGAVTEDGSSEPTSTVVRFAPGQLGRLANTQFQREVATNTSKFDPNVMRNNLNVIDADSRQQALNDQERDFLADKQYEKQVVDAAKQTGNVGLVRGVESAIADGGPEVVDMIGRDLGVARPQPTVTADPAQVDDSAPAQTDTQAPTAPAPWSMDSVDRNTTSGGLIASLEGVAKNRTANPRLRKAITPAGQTEKLMAYKAELEKNISTAEKLRANSPNFKVDPKQDGLPKKKAELAQINAYLDKDKPNLFAQEPATEAIATQTAGKTTKEIAQGINDGTIKVDRPTVQRVAQELQAAGIKEIRDLKRLTAKDAAIARAAIIASTDNPTIAARMTQEMVNIFDNLEGSPSMTRKDELTLQNSAADRAYRYKSLRNDMAKTTRSWNDAANTQAADVLAGAQDVFFGPNRDEVNLNYRSAAQFLRGKPFNGFNIWLKQSDRTDEEIANAMPGMTATLSLTIAAMAGEESGGRGIGGRIRESVIDLISRRDVEDAVDPADFDASRLRVDDPGVDKDGKPKATMIYYTDEDGNILNEDGGLQALKDLQPEMYANALSIGIYNTRKATGG